MGRERVARAPAAKEQIYDTHKDPSGRSARRRRAHGRRLDLRRRRSGPGRGRLARHARASRPVPRQGYLQNACERGRTVEVYRVDPGPDGLYDRTTSGAQGEWSIPAGMPNGKFYAVAKQRSIDAPGKTLVCKRATSPRVAF